MWQLVEILNVFNALTLKQIFWKRKIFFQKTGVLFFSWKHQDWKHIISILNCQHIRNYVKTNRMVSTKSTYHKERSFVSNYFIFLKTFLFSLRTSYKELIWCTNDPNVYIRTFCRSWSFIWRWFFSVGILFFSILCLTSIYNVYNIRNLAIVT